MRKFSPSRLTKKRDVKNLRVAIFFGLLSIFMIIGIIYLGVPFLIKLSIFLGNLKSSTTSPEIEDKIPPPPPQFIPLFEATNSAKINLSGFAEPGAKIEIFLGGISEQTVITDTNGNFTINNLEITEGLNEIYAIAVDKSGNISQKSEKITITLDKKPPFLNIIQPEDKATFYGLQKIINIKGESDQDATVSINDHLASMEAGGKFTYSLSLVSGENKIKIIATDKAGNQTEKEITVFLE